MISYPKFIAINTGNICSYKCIHCNNSKQVKTFLSFENLKNIISILPKSSSIDIGGYGDIFLHPDFEKIVKLLTEKEILFSFLTTGEFLTEENKKLLRNSPLKNIGFSINSLNKEIHNILSGGVSNLDIVISNFKKFVLKPRTYTVSISMVVNRLSYKEMPNFVQFGIDNDVDAIQFHKLMNGVEYPKDFELLNTDEEKNYFKQAYDIGENKKPIYLGGLYEPPKEPILEKANELIIPCKKTSIKECTQPWTSALVTIEGIVSLCLREDLSVGNIKNQTFDDIWNGEKANEIRTAIKNGDNKFCKTCVLYE